MQKTVEIPQQHEPANKPPKRVYPSGGQSDPNDPQAAKVPAKAERQEG